MAKKGTLAAVTQDEITQASEYWNSLEKLPQDFLLKRITCSSDSETCKMMRVPPTIIPTWERSEKFLWLKNFFDKSPQLAGIVYLNQIHPKAVAVLDRILTLPLDGEKDDVSWPVRRGAAEFVISTIHNMTPQGKKIEKRLRYAIANGAGRNDTLRADGDTTEGTPVPGQVEDT